MLYVFALHRAGFGYEPGDPVSPEFAATHPQMVVPMPEEPEQRTRCTGGMTAEEGDEDG